jgi:hypothetical protein
MLFKPYTLNVNIALDETIIINKKKSFSFLSNNSKASLLLDIATLFKQYEKRISSTSYEAI